MIYTPIKLIVNADDFGLCHSVNQAILDCFLKGNLTSTTMMTNMPGTNEAAQLSKDHPSLGVGLHFSLTEGQPLTACKSLTDSRGQFLDRGTLITKILVKKIVWGEVEKEFLAQLEKAIELDVNPTHVDSHQHVHLIPGIFRTILPHLESHKLPVRVAPTPINNTILISNLIKLIKQKIINYNILRLKRKYSKSPDFMLSMHDYPNVERGDDFYHELLQLVNGQSDKDGKVVELIVHPYINSDDLMSTYPSDYYQRLPFFETAFFEHQLLSRQENYFKSDKVELINYREIHK
ncbi:MAG: ChbG/HpnK family deacetylase [Cyclobacteriaceae bacterium]